MKKKQGIWGLILILMLVLSACNGGADLNNKSSEDPEKSRNDSTEELNPESGAQLTLWTVTNPWIEQAAAEFEQQYKVKVKIENIMWNLQLDKLKTDGPSGFGADVVNMQPDHLGDAVEAGAVLPNDYFEEGTIDKTMPSALNAAKYKGMLYGYPSNMFTYALYVNEDLAKGVKLDTWDDIKVFAKKFNDPKNNKYAFMMDSGNLSAAMMLGAGGYDFGKNGTDTSDIGLNSSGAVKGMEYFQSIKEILPLPITDMTGDVKDGLFQQGKLAINMETSSKAATYKDLPFKVKAIPLPKMPGNIDTTPYAGIDSFYVSAYTKYPNASKIFANFITSKEQQIEAAKLIGGKIPVANGITAEDFKDNQMLQAFIEQSKHTVPTPNIPAIRLYDQVRNAAVEDIWEGEDVKKTLDAATKKLKANIEDNQ
ncbi:sugar ABC transporter substrate-binding protein [Niallia sp. 03133]|uniref:sugar ABC transporter substrate-binding protein n=1 Tax=Niallia sp. 03133 TaxID=3458060 RepID=UPI0040447AC3